MFKNGRSSMASGTKLMLISAHAVWETLASCHLWDRSRVCFFRSIGDHWAVEFRQRTFTCRFSRAI